MREIKFRAWDKEAKKFVPIYEVGNLLYEIMANDKHDIYDTFELMQWTGLKDKNGTDIFDGDIMRLHPNDLPEWNRVITWECAAFECRQIHGKANFPLVFRKHLPEDEDWEVIGNIYSNPDLLAF